VSETGCESTSCVSFTISVREASYSLRGIPGATVVVSDSRGQVRARATTNSSGYADLHVPYDPDVFYYITVSADGYMPYTMTYEPHKLRGVWFIGLQLYPYNGYSLAS